jgi:hypothetical protein
MLVYVGVANISSLSVLLAKKNRKEVRKIEEKEGGEDISFSTYTNVHQCS